MTFSRIHTWGVNDELTSAQINALDIDHANSLDKTGDTIDDGTIVVSASGIISSQVNGGIVGTVSGAIQAGVAGAVESAVAGGFKLAGGASDWPTFGTNRTRLVAQPPNPVTLTTGWTYGTGQLIGPGTNQFINIELTRLHNGATLSSVTCFFSVQSAHAGVPNNMPQFTVYRMAQMVNGGSPNTVSDLNGVTNIAIFPRPANATLYVAGNLIQSWTYTCTQNNVIDVSQYRYAMALTDESGTSSVPGSSFFLGFQLAYTAIADMRFQ